MIFHLVKLVIKNLPVVSVRVCWRLFPALVGLGVEQTVVGVDGMTQVTSVVLLACGRTTSQNQPGGTVNMNVPACPCVVYTKLSLHISYVLQIH